MNEQENNRWQEIAWRRKLTPDETAELEGFLAAHPEARAEWQDEAGLSALLERLPEAPAVSSNFTAQVLQAVERDAAATERASALLGGFMWRNIWSWLPKTATALLVVGFTFLGYHRYEMFAQADLASNVAKLSSADPELMKDVEPILRMSQPDTKADTELLALMK